VFLITINPLLTNLGGSLGFEKARYWVSSLYYLIVQAAECPSGAASVDIDFNLSSYLSFSSNSYLTSASSFPSGRGSGSKWVSLPSFKIFSV